MNRRGLNTLVGAGLLAAGMVPPVARGQIYNWSTGQVIPGTEDITPGPGMNLLEWDTESRNLRYANLSGGLDLNGSSFYRCWLDHTWFMGANLINASFGESSLTNVSMATADVRFARFEGATLTNANLNGTNLTQSYFDMVSFTNADFSGAIILSAEFYTPFGFTAPQLYSTASYASGDLRSLCLVGADLTDWNFANQDLSNAALSGTLTNANFSGANLTHASLSGALDGASFDDATVNSVSLIRATAGGFTAAQLYSTASYKAADLCGIGLFGNDMTGWNFANQDLSGALLSHNYDWEFRSIMDNADLSGASLQSVVAIGVSLVNADLSRADTRGGSFLPGLGLAPAITHNTILPDGHIAGLDLGANETLKVRDYDDFDGIAITVDDAFQIDTAATVALIFEDADWSSTISLADGVLANLDGTLSLTFAPGTDVSSLLGVTFDLFKWNGGLLPGDTFGSVAWPTGFTWDLSDLYLGGTVTLTAVPEAATVVLLSLGALTFRRRR